MYVKWIVIALIVSTVVGVVSTIYGKYILMVNTIKEQELQIEDLTNTKIVLETDLNTERQNIDVLSKLLEETNKQFSILEVKYDNAIQKFNSYKRKTTEEKYKNQKTIDFLNNKIWESNKCEDGLIINRKISELKYEDL